MIRLLKMLGFAALVLLLGQISVDSRPIAEHFRLGVMEALGSARRGIAKSKLVASVSRHLPGYGVLPTLRSGASEEEDVDEESLANDHESVSTADRESLLRVLQ